jgi:hypothetical protein
LSESYAGAEVVKNDPKDVEVVRRSEKGRHEVNVEEDRRVERYRKHGSERA